MDLLQILQKIWRYRIVTLPVLALTLLGAIYVVALKESEYSATSSYVLINPPGPPTAEEIAADPAWDALTLITRSPALPTSRWSSTCWRVA